MRTIDIQDPNSIKIVIFPDGQPHVNISGIETGDNVKVIARLRDPMELMLLLQTSNALSNLRANKEELVIPYLMGARFDRIMSKGDSVDLRIVADMINYCGFKKVKIFDVHSDTALQLINNSESIDNNILIEQYTKPNSILICPDAGAAKKVYKIINKNIVDIVQCIKTRDLTNRGKITLQVLQPEKCKDKDCVIIDDLCDGGGTFLGIAEQITPKSLTLIVSHGIFSKGVDTLKAYFSEIIVSDSYSEVVNQDFVKVVKLKL